MIAASVFDSRTVTDFHAEIREVYKTNTYPWVIGYSGGKDSTATLQLVWHAIAALAPADRQKKVYVIASDTLVETPVIVDMIDQTLRKINATARAEDLPFSAHKVSPQRDQTFWVNLIGRGYPAPTPRFRWCTERMKINPANEFILQRASEAGEVVTVLGARISESSTRSQVLQPKDPNKIRQRTVPGNALLTRHTKLRRAYVYTPIKEWSTDDVWTYLLQVPSPWGGNNRDLAALYRTANAGECPLVIDDTTPSCGNSRFGCWVCTVVERDSTMNALIDSGEEWMYPLLQFRDWLAETRDPTRKHEFRDYKRRNGTVNYKADGTLIRGPYRLEFCQEILRRLLRTQQDVRRNGPDSNAELITATELHEIRRLWRIERQDFADMVPVIYRESVGDDLVWPQDDASNFAKEDAELLVGFCAANRVPVEMVLKLIQMERNMAGMARRSGILDRLDQILAEEWRSEDEILAHVTQRAPSDDD